MERINWYPGHMAKAKRLLADQLKRVDAVVELCDARLPYSSRNPDLDRLIAGKQRILLLNKADLAEPAATRLWVDSFRRGGLNAHPCQANAGKGQAALRLIEQATREAVDRAAEKGVRKTVRVMVVGVTNVGKSSFINRLHGGNIAKTGDQPGVTRANQWVRLNPWLEILDTPGLLWPRLDDQTAARRLCYIGSVSDQVVDLPMLTIALLEDLLQLKPEAVAARFRVRDPELRGEALLEAVCRGRGFLMKGGVPDVDRCCSVVLDEFRGGRLGPVTLEMPGEEKQDAEDRPERPGAGTDRLG